MGDGLACVEGWYEPSWGVNCRPSLIWLIAKGYAQIVSDVSVDASEVLYTHSLPILFLSFSIEILVKVVTIE
jgi:hypothetical protein